MSCRKIGLGLSVALLALPLAACDPMTTTLGAGSAYMSGMFDDPDVNMTQRNYAAADYTIQQGADFIDKTDLIRMEPLIDIDEPRITSKIARLIPEQIGVRWAQLGYLVDIRGVNTGPDTNYLRGAEAALKQAPDFVLSGTYHRQRREVLVKLRLTETQSGRIVSSFDYSLPARGTVGNLSKPKPQIFKIQE